VDRGRSGGALWTHGGTDRGHGGALTGARAALRRPGDGGAECGGAALGEE
jgi:hypothetical protein